MSSSSSPTYHLFPLLPTEISLMVWEIYLDITIRLHLLERAYNKDYPSSITHHFILSQDLKVMSAELKRLGHPQGIQPPDHPIFAYATAQWAHADTGKPAAITAVCREAREVGLRVFHNAAPPGGRWWI